MSSSPLWVGYKTIVRKEITRILRIWGQTIVPPAITMTLYFIIFGELIGRRIGEMGGFTYMQYIVPGLVIMSVITNSYGNMVSSFFGAKYGKHIEELLISPLPNWIILAGDVTGALTRGLMVGAVVMVVSLFFTHSHLYTGAVDVPRRRVLLDRAVAGILAKSFSSQPDPLHGQWLSLRDAWRV